MKKNSMRLAALALFGGFLVISLVSCPGFEKPRVVREEKNEDKTAARPLPDPAQKKTSPAAPGEEEPVSTPAGANTREQEFFQRLSAAALERTRHHVIYDPSYFRIPYPGGDVPPDRGVCTDVVIRSYRAAGIDLQKEVHEDMEVAFSSYPRLWGLDRPDPNIDHRRVANLMTFFSRKGEVLPITRNPADYRPGDIVAWDLGGGVLHIGIVVDKKSRDGRRSLVVHNIGAGPRLEDALFSYRIIGHYRYPRQAALENPSSGSSR